MPFKERSHRLWYVIVSRDPIDLELIAAVSEIEKSKPEEPFYNKDGKWFQSPDTVFGFTVSLKYPAEPVTFRFGGYTHPRGDYQNSAKGARQCVYYWRKHLLEALEWYQENKKA